MKAHAWKACVRATVPRVRIPSYPPSDTFLRCVAIIDGIDGGSRENGLVEKLACVVGDSAVEIACLCHELEEQVNPLSYDCDVGRCAADEALSVGDLGSNVFLSRLDLFGRENTIKVGVDEPLLFELQGAQTLLLHAVKFGGVCALGIEDGVGLGTCPLDLVGGELNLCVPFRLHRLLDALNGQAWQVAGGATGVPAQVEEVLAIE